MDEQSEEVKLEPQGPEGPRATPPAVFIAASALADMNSHAAAEADHEIGGIMVGTVIEGDCPVVKVEAAIRGTKMTYTRGSVTFTHDTWSEINRIKDEQYPDQRIVGWYHSHPGFGLFLSGHDLFIHRNFFTAPYQVAFVTDPRAGTFGCFTWQDGDLAQDHAFRVMAAPTGYPTGQIEASPVAEAPPPTPMPALPTLTPASVAPHRDPGMLLALWLLSGFVALLLALTLSNFAALGGLPQRFASVNSRLDRLAQDLQGLRNAPPPTPAARETAPASPPGPPPAAAPDGGTRPEGGATPRPASQEGGEPSGNPPAAAP